MQGQIEMEYYCLKWKDRQYNMLHALGSFLNNEALCDVTIACDGPSLKAHKLILSAASSFFQNLFIENPSSHPIIILPELKYIDLKALIDFMYLGQVNVAKNRLPTILKAAESLKIKGLGDCHEQCLGENHTPESSQQNNQIFCENSNNSSHTSDSKYQKSACTAEISREKSIATDDAQQETKFFHDVSDCDKESGENASNQIEEGTSDSLCEIIPSKLMEQTLITGGMFQGKPFLESENVSMSSFTTEEKGADYDRSRINMSDTTQQSEMMSPNFHLNQDFRCFIKDVEKNSNDPKSSSSVYNEEELMMCTNTSDDIENPSSETAMSVWDSKKVYSPGPKRGRKPGSRLCVLCKHVFSSETDFKTHMDCHRNESLPSDAETSKYQEMTDTTDSQMISERNLLKLPLACSTCSYVMTALSDAQSHLSTNPQCRTSQFKCLLCPKIFIWPATLMKHFREQHEGPGGSTRVTRRLWFFCDVCKKPLLSKHALSLHRSKFHGLSSHSNLEGPVENAMNCKRGRKQGTRVCRFCKRTFLGSVDYHQHIQNFHKNVDSLNPVTDASLNMSESTSSAENESNSSQNIVIKKEYVM